MQFSLLSSRTPYTLPATSLRLFLNLRWLALLGLGTLLLVAVYGLDVSLQYVPILLSAGVLAGSNIFVELYYRNSRGLPAIVAGFLLLLDIALLTVVLFSSGGPTNPFSVMYLVHIALAAVLLDVKWTWFAAGSSILLYGLLFLLPSSESMHDMHGHGHDGGFSLHLQGMWFAFSLAAMLVAMFLCRILQSMKARDEELHVARVQALQNERFVSLVTLSAGAAHELSTPLGTIALAAAELERRLREIGSDDELIEDAALLRAEVIRCRRILDEMRGQADSAGPEEYAVLSQAEFLAGLRQLLPKGACQHVQIDLEAAPGEFYIPEHGLLRVLAGVIKNALESSVLEPQVKLNVQRAAGYLLCEVQDNGTGMTPEVVAKCTEPFFTTKPAGKGMGLGLFLARIFCERHGGDLQVRSSPGEGTTVALRLYSAEMQRAANSN